MSDLSDDAKTRLNKEHAKGRMDQAGGAFDELKGKVKKNVGDAFGDRSMQAEGAAEEMAGKARKNAAGARANAADKAEDIIDRNG
jgi:uncharacterized protein YjbJ (UPF0337 family)